jgi:UDP-glucose 4-epimerase
MPYVCRVAAGQLPELQIFGDDYPTADGTGVRDYIHVCDLAEGHLAALQALASARPGEVITANLGTGRGVSVKELVDTFERVNGVPVRHEIVARRPGDAAVSFADPSYALARLNWAATRDVEVMCRDAWRFTRNAV